MARCRLTQAPPVDDLGYDLFHIEADPSDLFVARDAHCEALAMLRDDQQNSKRDHVDLCPHPVCCEPESPQPSEDLIHARIVCRRWSGVYW